MLNTDTRGAKALIWLSILVIFATFAWSFWLLPAPATMIASLLSSDLAEFAARNQFWLTGLTGFGGASVAYILNGWRDRTERRHVVERAVKKDGAVLAREAIDIAAACEASARALMTRSAPLAATIADLKSATTVDDHLILAATPADLARLGWAAAAAARTVRSSVRRLTDAFELAGRDDATANHTLAARTNDAIRASREAAEVFTALATGGPAAAERVRLPLSAGPAAAESPEANAGTDKPARLHSAA